MNEAPIDHKTVKITGADTGSKKRPSRTTVSSRKISQSPRVARNAARSLRD